MSRRIRQAFACLFLLVALGAYLGGRGKSGASVAMDWVMSLDEWVINHAAFPGFFLLFIVAGAALLVPDLWGAFRGRFLPEIPKLAILAINFDDLDASELYVDFRLSNPGEPSTFGDWALSIQIKKDWVVRESRPSVLSTRATFGKPHEGPAAEDLADHPLEQGGVRIGRVTYSHPAPARAAFNKAGTRFVLRVRDVAGHRIQARYVLDHAISMR